MVRKGIGTDARIGSKFLYSGCGYGGSCFPKDVKALVRTGREYGYEMEVIDAVERVNDRQKQLLYSKFLRINGGEKGVSLKGKRAAIWGLSFKPETDDMREATSLVLIESLLEAGCEVAVYDPVSMDEARHKLGDSVSYATDMYDAVVDADVLFLVTEWKEFRLPSWKVMRRTMRGNLVLDGRNIYDPAEVKSHGFTYEGIGIR